MSHQQNQDNNAYTNIVNFNNKFYPRDQNPKSLPTLPPGCYKIDVNDKEWWFSNINFNFDAILDLPSEEFKFVTNQFSNFLKPETKEKFQKYGFLYKRSVLLHGLWGTGKSVITNRIAEEVVRDYNGVCLFVKNPYAILAAFEALDSLQPETPVVIILEELDEILCDYERDLLTLLDGAIQKDNVMFLATTNYIDRIPKRILRPGRFGLVVQVKYPNEEARRMYFETKLGKDHPRVEEFTDATLGLSVDELKEVILSCVVFENELLETITRLKDTRDSGKNEGNPYGEEEAAAEAEYNLKRHATIRRNGPVAPNPVTMYHAVKNIKI